jgi:26S proteasome regulatory subunit N6
VKQTYSEELMDDPVIKRHFNLLYNSLLERNLLKIIRPYSEVQIDYVATQICLPLQQVQQKLSEMILDEMIDGTLDQGRGCLIVFEEAESTAIFDHSSTTFKNLDNVMDSLYEKAKKIKTMK